MTIKERSQDLSMAVEIVRKHLFEHLGDSELCKDMCATLAILLRRVHEDAEKSAKAWDKRAFFLKADALRREMGWALPLAELAESLAYSRAPFTRSDAERLLKALPANLEMPKRPRFKSAELMRGAAAAARQTLLKR